MIRMQKMKKVLKTEGQNLNEKVIFWKSTKIVNWEGALW